MFSTASLSFVDFCSMDGADITLPRDGGPFGGKLGVKIEGVEAAEDELELVCTRRPDEPDDDTELVDGSNARDVLVTDRVE